MREHHRPDTVGPDEVVPLLTTTGLHPPPNEDALQTAVTLPEHPLVGVGGTQVLRGLRGLAALIGVVADVVPNLVLLRIEHVVCAVLPGLEAVQLELLGALCPVAEVGDQVHGEGKFDSVAIIDTSQHQVDEGPDLRPLVLVQDRDDAPAGRTRGREDLGVHGRVAERGHDGVAPLAVIPDVDPAVARDAIVESKSDGACGGAIEVEDTPVIRHAIAHTDQAGGVQGFAVVDRVADLLPVLDMHVRDRNRRDDLPVADGLLDDDGPLLEYLGALFSVVLGLGDRGIALADGLLARLIVLLCRDLLHRGRSADKLLSLPLLFRGGTATGGEEGDDEGDDGLTHGILQGIPDVFARIRPSGGFLSRYKIHQTLKNKDALMTFTAYSVGHKHHKNSDSYQK